MKITLTIALGVIGLAISSPAHPGDHPDDIDPRQVHPGYIDQEHYSILGVTLDERGVDSVTPILGTPHFVKGISGDAACYVGPDKTAIVFEKTLMAYGYTVYSAERSSAVLERHDCLTVAGLTRKISNGAGLGLGTSRAAVKKLLGPQKKTDHKKYTYGYWATPKMTKEESKTIITRFPAEERTKELLESLRWEIFSSIEIDFNDKGVSQFSIFTSKGY